VDFYSSYIIISANSYIILISPLDLGLSTLPSQEYGLVDQHDHGRNDSKDKGQQHIVRAGIGNDGIPAILVMLAVNLASHVVSNVLELFEAISHQLGATLLLQQVSLVGNNGRHAMLHVIDPHIGVVVGILNGIPCGNAALHQVARR
jgi:hypothetical protein